jgi:hypothetical protein
LSVGLAALPHWGHALMFLALVERAYRNRTQKGQRACPVRP